MSNYQTYFFIFSVWGLICSSSLCAQQLSPNEARQEKLRASVFFEQKSTDKAIASYEKLLASGYFSEKSLYELASLYEEQADWLQAIFILKKIQLHYGGEEIDFRLAYLEDQIKSHVPLARYSLTEIEKILFQKQHILLIGAIARLLIALVGIIISKQKIMRAIGLFASCMALLLSTYLGYQALLQPRAAVLMQSSSFYNQPSYAATRLNLPLEPGQSIQIHEQQDIWYRISQGPYEGWVPFFVVRKLVEE